MDLYVPPPEAACADEQATFRFPQVRICLLTSRLVRVEYSPEGRFEDRPSQVFWYRRQPVPPAACRYDEHGLTIETEAFRLSYLDSVEGLRGEAFSLVVKPGGAVAHVDSPNQGRLPGTARTLDATNGRVKLKPGLVSRSGWVQLDDTPSLVFNTSGWLEPRPRQRGYRDLYFLVSGQNYRTALQHYQRVTGTPPVIPRAMLGNWWSRFWEYSQGDIQQLVERFGREQVPLSVFIIDMDWHITKTSNACSGWTGFSWNRALFPDPPGLLKWLHEQGLITSLNLHPAEGIHPHEERYPQVAAAMGHDPAKKRPVPFTIDDPRFAQAYFDLLLHPLEEQGVDFWWIDWQQGRLTGLPGLDPLWWLNHLHFFDLGRGGRQRPVVFSRWGGPGNHRYPIGFSGDTIISWRSLAYQPIFTAAAANAAYGWWSHDIGGHMRGLVPGPLRGKQDPELFVRWVQFGALSPILRLHGTKDPSVDHRPWAFDAEILRLVREAMQFRHALVPYLYSMAYRNAREGVPLITPLYYDFPKEDSAYEASGQYLLGSELMAAPVTSPTNPKTGRSQQRTWFPPGEWFDFFAGESFTGPHWKTLDFKLSEIPLYARAGAILPLQAEAAGNGVPNPKAIDLVVFPGPENIFRLLEDNGEAQEALDERGICVTEFTTEAKGNTCVVRIAKPAGRTDCIPPQRSYRILVRGVARPDGVEAALEGKRLDLPESYQSESHTLVIGPFTPGIDRGLELRIRLGGRRI